MKKFIEKFILDKNFKKNLKKEKKRIFFKEIDEKQFKKRKKQLKLNFNKFNFINHIIKNKFIIYILFLLILIAFLLMLIFSPYTKIKNINIIKKDDITNINIAYNSVNDYRGKSILNIDKKEIEEKIKKYQSNIQNIDIKIKFPNLLKISLESYIPLFYTNLKENYYLILNNGSLVPYGKENTNLKVLNIIESKENKSINYLDYKKIYDEKYINNIYYIIKKIKENIINLNIENLNYYLIERELHIKTENTILIFSLENDISNQIKSLIIFNKEQESITKKGIYYIDLRIDNKIFYCPIENEFQCKKNIDNIYN